MTLANVQHPNLSGIPTDWVPVTPDDANDLMGNQGRSVVGLYIQGGGDVAVQFRGTSSNPEENSPTRVISVPDEFIMPGRVTRVRATDTTATNIYALIG